MVKTIDVKDVWKKLEQVSDPEVPVLSVVDLGVVRDIQLTENGGLHITITPTYSGCPAMNVMEHNIRQAALTFGVEVEVTTTLSPPWTTDWLTESGKNKLREYGIAPPEDEVDKNVLFGKPTVIPCPKCGSKDTKMVSHFGSTACKAHYQCNTCLEPFDYFKCHR